MKKILALLLILAMVFSFAACGGDDSEGDKDTLKIGFIFLHDQNSTYDKNFIDAANATVAKLGLTADQVIMKTNIPEGDECYVAATELVAQGCDLIFADSFGHEPYMIQAAEEFPNVEFCHSTGTKSLTVGLKNYHNAFASIYEGRYLAGIAAGMKLNEMIAAGKFTAAEAKMGYVGAFPYAEVISGYTSFYLGAKSVCPTVTMEVKYTTSWFDITAENTAANALIESGCKLISQHADSSGAPSACEEKGVPNVAYNVDTSNIGPNTAIISSKINWAPYFELIIDAVMNDKAIPTDWTGTIATGSVELTTLNTKNAAPGTQEAIDAAKAKLISGELKVFDTSKFTVGGKTLTTYLADVKDAGDYVPETEAIVDGRFIESELRSAPYFNIIIDGITAPQN